MNLKKIIKKPIITEKFMSKTAQDCYAFKVDKKSTKNQIREAIEEKFKVNVIKVRTIVVKGKTRLSGKRKKKVKLGDWKKAIIKIKKGQKIKGFGGEDGK